MTVTYWKTRVREALARSAPGRQPDDGLVDELAQHLHDVYRHALSSGQSEDAARASADREVGRLARHAADVRRARTEAFRPPDPAPLGWRILDDFRLDVKHSARTLAANRTFSLV